MPTKGQSNWFVEPKSNKRENESKVEVPYETITLVPSVVQVPPGCVFVPLRSGAHQPVGQVLRSSAVLGFRYEGKSESEREGEGGNNQAEGHNSDYFFLQPRGRRRQLGHVRQDRPPYTDIKENVIIHSERTLNELFCTVCLHQL